MKRTREEGDPKLILYSYWRSSCSWRVRIALELKQLPYEYRAINLLKGEDYAPEYLRVNPAGLLPTLIDGTTSISESLAILEYIDEKYPGRKGSFLLPRSLEDRAAARGIALHIACGIQPIQNLGVLEKIESLGGKDARAKWGREAIHEGFVKLETLLKRSAKTYCVGEEVSIADLCLVPQVYNATRFGVQLSEFPTIHAVHERLCALEAFKAAHPDRMPDAVPA